MKPLINKINYLDLIFISIILFIITTEIMNNSSIIICNVNIIVNVKVSVSIVVSIMYILTSQRDNK